jgi:DNA-3-methyladenine glycosylase
MRFCREFFERTALEVAPELLGCLLVHELDGVRLVGRIVEVEAYLGDGTDPASHAHRGPTPRAASMFGAAGRFYVYRSMGIHACANLVCEPPGRASAVLLRAVEPLRGIEHMQSRREGRSGCELASGPGKLTRAFGIGLEHDGASALRGSLRVEPGPAASSGRVLAGPRVGIRRAADLPYRYWLADNPHVTRTPLNRRAIVRAR